MRVLIYGINFFPEPVGVGRYTAEMAERLQRAGHDVLVVTALPYYPEWKVADAYAGKAYVDETWRNIRILRAPLWVPFRPGGRKRILHLLSFAATSVPSLVRALLWRPDVVWMAAPAFVCAPGALLTAKLSGAKSWLHVQDYEIDIAFGMGLISGSWWSRIIRGAERWLMRRFDRVSTISQAMMARALAKGVASDKLSHVPNWADVQAIKPLRTPSTYRSELDIPVDGVVALYSGTMGPKQGIDWLAQVAVLLRDQPELYVVLCGDGASRAAAEAVCGHLPNVRFLPLQPVERLGQLLGLADIHLLPQRSGATEMVMPSKLTGMLASGRSIVVMAEPGTELADVVKTCGIVVPHGDVPAFAGAIRELAAQPQWRIELGHVARAYADKHLAAGVVVGQLERELLDLVNDVPVARMS